MSTLLTGDESHRRIAMFDEMEKHLLRLQHAGKLTPEVAREIVHFDLIHLDEIPERKH